MPVFSVPKMHNTQIREELAALIEKKGCRKEEKYEKGV